MEIPDQAGDFGPSDLAERTRRICTIMMWGIVLLGALITLFYLGTGIAILTSAGGKAVILLPNGQPGLLPGYGLIVQFALTLVRVALLLWILWNAFLLFRGYRREAVFTRASGERLRSVGFGFLLLLALSIVSRAVISMIATPNQVYFGVSDGEVVPAVMGILLLTIGHICVLGAMLKEETGTPV